MRLSLMWDREGAAPDGWLRHVPVQWRDIEGARGQYGFRLVEKWLTAKKAPVFLAFQFSTENRTRHELLDLTPSFHAKSLALSAGGFTGAIPNYADAGWRRAIYAAVRALAEQYRDDPRVEAFFWGPGVNDEINAVVDWDDAKWSADLRTKLSSQAYYDFILESTALVLEAWKPKRVYLAAAPAPGTPWGERRKDVTRAALQMGAGYRCNGLYEDFGNAVGLGEHLGTGMYELAAAADFCAFEGGLFGTGQPEGRLYWMLLQAAHWHADHVNLQKSWLPQAEAVQGLVPAGLAWAVFRGAEYPPQSWTSNGKLYGQAGVPWEFGNLARIKCDVAPIFRRSSWGFDRWSLTMTEAFDLATDLPDGDYLVETWRPDGTRCQRPMLIMGHKLTLPPGSYHRVDVLKRLEEQPPVEVLSLEDRVLRLEKLHGLA